MNNDLHLEHENARRILEEGWTLFQLKGYRGVNIDELCRRCGLTKPTLYYYFQDKENLFVQVLQYKLRGFHAVIERPGLLAERLERVATSILDSFQVQYIVLLRDREHLKRPENLEGIRHAFHQELFSPLIDLMQAGMAQGQLRGDNPETLALIFLGIINNFIGKSAEMHLANAALARMLCGFFLYGVMAQSVGLSE